MSESGLFSEIGWKRSGENGRRRLSRDNSGVTTGRPRILGLSSGLGVEHGKFTNVLAAKNDELIHIP